MSFYFVGVFVKDFFKLARDSSPKKLVSVQPYLVSHLNSFRANESGNFWSDQPVWKVNVETNLPKLCFSLGCHRIRQYGKRYELVHHGSFDNGFSDLLVKSLPCLGEDLS